MRRLWVGLVAVLVVALALSIGVNIGLMLGEQQSGGASPSPSPIQSQPTASSLSTEQPTPTPIPTAAVTPAPQTTTITDHNITVNYSEYRRESTADGATTTVVVSIDAQGEAMTLDYSRFYLSILTSRGGLEPYPIYLESSKAYPFESGSVTIGGDQSQASFKLTFRFSTLQQTSMGGITSFHSYELRYI